MTLREEISRIPELLYVGNALVEFASVLGDVDFHEEGGRWVARPHNYVTFKVQATRKQDIVVTLRGLPHEFEQQSSLPLRPDRGGYSRFNLSSVTQLCAAASYIKRAHELFTRGRGRPPKRPITTEI